MQFLRPMLSALVLGVLLGPAASGQSPRLSEPEARSTVVPLAWRAEWNGTTIEFVGIERPTASASRAPGDGEPEEPGRPLRKFGPLAVSGPRAEAESWALAVRVQLVQDPSLPVLERPAGELCAASPGNALDRAVTVTAESPVEIVGVAAGPSATFAAGVHDRAVRGLEVAATILALRAGTRSSDPALIDEALRALDESARAWLAQPEPSQSIETIVSIDPMGLVATIEYWDARQALMSALQRKEDAALARATLRWHLARLGAERLLGLLDERVPSVGQGFLSLTACTSWPHDAWELVEAERRLRAERDLLRERVRELTMRAAGRFDSEYASMLRNAMAFVGDSLPGGLRVSEGLLREIEAYLSRPLDDEATLRAGLSLGDVALTRNRGNAELTTRAWEVWGRLLATGGLPPAEEARRQEQTRGWYEMAAQRALDLDVSGTLAQGVLIERAGAFEALMSDPWSGWAFRAVPDGVYERAMQRARGSLSLALQQTKGGSEQGLRDALRISAWELHLELQREGLGRGPRALLTPFPRQRLKDAGHGGAISIAPARRRLTLDDYYMYPPGKRPAPRWEPSP